MRRRDEENRMHQKAVLIVMLKNSRQIDRQSESLGDNT
jgi:hypothetical protein